MLALVGLGAHVGLEVLVERALVAHRLLADGADVGVVGSLVDLAVALERVVGGEGGAAQLAGKLLEAAVQLDVVLQRQDRLHLLAAQVAHVVALIQTRIPTTAPKAKRRAGRIVPLRRGPCCCAPAVRRAW